VALQKPNYIYLEKIWVGKKLYRSFTRILSLDYHFYYYCLPVSEPSTNSAKKRSQNILT